MDVRVLNLQGDEVGRKTALTAWEGRRVSPHALHQVAVAAMTNRRVFRAHTKNRAERRGGGRKPWRQKGTGRARHGSIRSPLWRKGGVTFGPRADRTYATNVPRAMRRSALAATLVGKVRDGELILVDRLPDVRGKTKELQAALKSLPVRASTLILVAGSVETRAPFLRASWNLPGVAVSNPEVVAAGDLLRHTTILTTPEGVDILERRLAVRRD